MRCDPLFEALRYGLPSAPVQSVIGGTRYTATTDYDVDDDEFEYRLTIASPATAPIDVSAVRLGLFGRHRGALIAWRGRAIVVRDTAEIADAELRAAVERALARAGAIGTVAARPTQGLPRKGAGFRRRPHRAHAGSTS